MTTKIEQYDNNTHQRFTTKQNVDKALHTLEGILKGISYVKKHKKTPF